MSTADHDRWTAVDGVIDDHLFTADDVLTGAMADAEAAGLPPIAVTAAQGRLLALIVRAIGAGRVLEVGTLGGYSAIWMGRALPADGRLVTLEAEPRHVEVARANLDRAGLSDRVDVVQGAALDTLPTLTGPFDLAFVDADKEHNADYFEWALRLVRPGGVIIVDNVVRGGAIADPASTDSRVAGVHRMFAAMAARPDAETTAIQTVGAKGYDGFTFTVVPDPPPA